MPKYKITYGGWYQRTTLHLSEVFDFLSHASSTLDLSKDKLKALHHSLKLKEVSREVGYLEYVKALTQDGIEIRYYEDGLYILEIQDDDVRASQYKLSHYFEHVFSPAIAYIFSLGAPTPKVLANIQSTHPTVVTVTDKNPEKYAFDSKYFGEVYSKITSADMTVFKTHDYIFLVSKPAKVPSTDLIEMQIFFREYKDQLEKYLNIHRGIWEEIAEIKEKKFIRGSEIELVRSKLDRYQKTINLISNRINQMGTYVSTRSSISRQLELEDHLTKLFQYKFETLTNTHAYIKEIWAMTREYLTSAISVLVELKNQSTKSSLTSLTVITTVGVVASLINYISTTKLPVVTQLGLVYYLILIVITALINWLVSFVFKSIKYKLTLHETEKNL